MNCHLGKIRDLRLAAVERGIRLSGIENPVNNGHFTSAFKAAASVPSRTSRSGPFVQLLAIATLTVLSF
jgi:hypothetical protein